MLLITLIIAAVIVIGMFLWAAVKMKAIQTQQEIMKNIKEDLEDL